MSYYHRTQKTVITAALPSLQTILPQRAFHSEAETPTPTNSGLSLQAELDRANRLGHHFSRVGVLSDTPAIQPKLTIGQPGDQYEQEADQMAAQVMSMPEKQDEPVQRSGGEELKEEELQMKPQIQRQEMPEEEEELQMKPQIQRQEIPEEEEEMLQTKAAAALTRSAATAGLEQQLSSTKGSGSPLPDDVRSFMEPRFGADFSGVRVHTNSSASEMNQSIQAKAFTHGQDIYFNSGNFEPESTSGKELLAHELTHVIQQTGRKKNSR